MNKKVLFFIPIILVIPVIVYFQSVGTEEKPINSDSKLNENSIALSQESDERFVPRQYDEFENEDYIFKLYVKNTDLTEINGQMIRDKGLISPDPKFQEIYDEVGVRIEKQNTVVIYPIFTASAYNSNGFYDYYQGFCDESCLTVKVEPIIHYNSSGLGLAVLLFLGYEVVNDVYVHNNPEKLKEYDKVIVLHNEYVTKTVFDAITSHPKVMYLYPNALFAEVEYSPDSDTITLIRGHFYPDKEIYNGFDWEFDNSPLELQGDCTKWEFYEIDNGVMLNCYPEYLMVSDKELLKAIKDF